MTKEYQNLLEDFRNHYKKQYDILLDDEILYFFIRVNEMQVALSKQINGIPKVTFPKGKDYFLYGVGKSLYTGICVALCGVLLALSYAHQTSSGAHEIMKNGHSYLQVEYNRHDYLIPLNETIDKR